jgi:hypothetical protein
MYVHMASITVYLSWLLTYATVITKHMHRVPGTIKVWVNGYWFIQLQTQTFC